MLAVEDPTFFSRGENSSEASSLSWQDP
jgi:hypothetical protein